MLHLKLVSVESESLKSVPEQVNYDVTSSVDRCGD